MLNFYCKLFVRQIKTERSLRVDKWKEWERGMGEKQKRDKTKRGMKGRRTRARDIYAK
jgi:hypothetical protein